MIPLFLPYPLFFPREIFLPDEEKAACGKQKRGPLVIQIAGNVLKKLILKYEKTGDSTGFNKKKSGFCMRFF